MKPNSDAPWNSWLSSHIAARSTRMQKRFGYNNSSLLMMFAVLLFSLGTKTYAIDLPDFEGLVRDQGNALCAH